MSSEEEPQRQRWWRRPLVHSVEGSEAGPTLLHHLAPAPAAPSPASTGLRWLWPAALALAAIAAAAASSSSSSLSLRAPPPRSTVAAVLVFGLLLLLLVRRLIRSRAVVAESILVVAGLGLQLQTHFADGREAVQFVDLAKVRAVVVNEGITMHRVIYYLAVIVEGREKLLVAFPRLQPRLEELLPVYESLKRVLAATTRAQRARGQEGGGPEEGMAGGD